MLSNNYIEFSLSDKIKKGVHKYYSILLRKPNAKDPKRCIFKSSRTLKAWIWWCSGGSYSVANSQRDIPACRTKDSALAKISVRIIDVKASR